MNLKEEHAWDSDSDEDYYVDLMTSSKERDDSETDILKKLEKSKHTAKALRITRHSVSDNKNYKSAEKNDLNSEEESDKSRSDALWADFLGGVVTESVIDQKTDFAGGKKINACNSSKESCIKYNGTEIIQTPKHYCPKNKWTTPASVSRLGKIKRPSAENGIGSIMNKLEKKRNLSVLERSQLDWKIFKQDEGIDELLCSHNKGKDGYLDRQDFLQRTDLRQFEIEKNLRQSRRPY
ncbi:uncharacterized protein Dere_GG10889 [Drosophila erecta]|uniref:Craniofacial development protein 1 n=2 Tax=Drosophila erecta TaxID=7220 RepID=B3N457_DROER|nr:uncharacterized protein Dere_GG10889 [Drosophila erecta]